MKKVLIIGMMLLSGIFYAQISFEKAYFINNNGEKTDCFIKNIDWKNNPADFEFKKTIDSQVEKTNIKQVKEFGIYEVCKYERHLVDIDTSSTNINNLSDVPTPLFKQKELFLKTLVAGKANLYKYEDELGVRYFYKTESTPVKQLIYKKSIDYNRDLFENNDFRKQLWADLNQDGFTMKEFSKLPYKAAELTSVFEKYNLAKSTTSENFAVFEKQKKITFALSAKFSVGTTSLKNNFDDPNIFDNEVSLRYGLEAAFILPYNKNKWAVIVEPTYQSYKTEKQSSTLSMVDYKSIEIPIGLRHYMFINDQSKMFLETAYIFTFFDFSINSTMKVNYREPLDVNSGDSYLIGLGYDYKGKYSIGIKHFFGRNILDGYLLLESNYSNTSIVFGYKIL